MQLNPQRYPIDEQLSDISKALKQHNCLLLKAQTGAGKTTRLPPYLCQDHTQTVLVLQPRRLATKLAAKRCAQILETQLGDEVGHHIRFDKLKSKRTRLLFITEGLFLNSLRDDPNLLNYTTIILDEFHERSIHTDTALCLIRRLQAKSRPDLKLIIMSATLDTTQLESYLQDVKVINVKGRTFPLTIEYHPIAIEQAIVKMLESKLCKKNILVFLDGMVSIRKLSALLKPLIDDEIEIVPLHSSLSKKEQQRAFVGENKKIILSTNIAETSLTIPGVTGVIDTGYERRSSFAPWSGMPILEKEKVSKASATQRAGRAGREEDGIVYRTYTKDDFSLRQSFTPSQVSRVELSSFSLNLLSLGHSPLELNWFEKPNEKNLLAALSYLELIGGQKDVTITELGREISHYPLHPRLALIAHKAKDEVNFKDILLAVCVISEGSILKKSTKFYYDDDHQECDISLQVDLYKSIYWADDSLSPYQSHLVDMGQYHRVSKLYKSLSLKHSLEYSPLKTKCNQSELSRFIFIGFPDRVAIKRSVVKKNKTIESYNFCMGRGGKLSSSSALLSCSPDLIVVLDAIENPKANASVATEILKATKIDSSLLEKYYPNLITNQTQSLFNEKKSTLTLSTVKKYSQITIQTSKTQPFTPNEEQLCELMLAHWPWPFKDDQALVEYNRRVKVLNTANIEHNCPQLEAEMFELFIQSITQEYTSYKKLQSQSLAKLIYELLSETDKYNLDEYAPLFITLENKKRFEINYQEDSPYINARIQDLYSVKEHPHIGSGNTPIIINLLSPANREIQKCYDIKELWQGSWQLLKDDLRPRYPKHYWPSNPQEALPIRMKKDIPTW